MNNRLLFLMKITIKIEFDGRFYIGSCENIPGCYVQARKSDEINLKIKRALTVVKRNCDERSQSFPTGPDRPLFDTRIRFDELSTDQLVKFFEHQKYHLEFIDEESVLVMNSSYPFNRIHLPRVDRLSPLLVQKLFGKENTIYVGASPFQLNTKVSSSA